MRYKISALLLLALLVGLTLLSVFTVSERESVVLTQFGKPSRTITDAGLHVKRPGFLETVNRIDTRTHVFTSQSIELLLGDKNPIVLTSYVCWKVSDPLLFFQSLINSDVATQKLGDMINSQLGGVLGEYTLQNIINTDPSRVMITEIEDKILQNTNRRAQDKYGIEIVQVGLSRITYPTIVTKAVFNRMRSEREKEAKKFSAEGREEASRIRAQADREAAELLAEAYSKAQILKGEGDQLSLQMYSRAFAKDPEFFEFTKSMEIYEDILDNKSTLVLSTDSELFKYLNGSTGKP